MKRLSFLLVLAGALLVNAAVSKAEDETTTVQARQGPAGAFVDADGDGVNDLAPDADGDGVVNHLDDDYAPQGRARGRGAHAQFIDEDGDGLNDLAPDDDGDGIPNGQDPDFERPEYSRKGWKDGAEIDGARPGRGRGGRGAGRFVDADGDGVNDLAPDADGDGVVNCLDDDYAPQKTDVDRAQGQRGHRGGRGGRGGGRR